MPVTEAGTLGGLIPMWILGAPFLFALYELMTTPRPRRTLRHDERP
jgi:hypothetical protein